MNKILKDLPISRIGYGCYALSGAYGNKLSEKEKIKLLNQAFDLGITFYDTASSYNDTECVMGKAFENKRSQIVISSKISMNRIISNLSKKNVIKSCEISLKNLNTDYLDIYQIHYDDPYTPISETIAGFEQLKKDGKIRYYGVGHLPIGKTIEYLNHGNLSTILAEMSVVSLFRYKELYPLLSSYDFNIIAFSVTGRGLLSRNIDEKTKFHENDIRSMDPLFKRSKLDFALKITNKLHMIGQKYNKTTVQLGLLWVLHKKGILSALIGPTQYNHLKENVSIMDDELSLDIIREIDNLLEKEQQLLEIKLCKDVNDIINSELSSNYLNAFNDLVYILEYCIENMELSYELGIKIYKKLLVERKSKKTDIEVLKEIKHEIKHNRLKKVYNEN